MGCQVTKNGKMMFHSRTGQMPVGLKHMKLHPVDGELNVWFKTHMSKGWKPCASLCAGGRPPMWYNIYEEDPPFVTPYLRRLGCAGLCCRARSKARNMAQLQKQ